MTNFALSRSTKCSWADVAVTNGNEAPTAMRRWVFLRRKILYRVTLEEAILEVVEAEAILAPSLFIVTITFSVKANWTSWSNDMSIAFTLFLRTMTVSFQKNLIYYNKIIDKLLIFNTDANHCVVAEKVHVWTIWTCNSTIFFSQDIKIDNLPSSWGEFHLYVEWRTFKNTNKPCEQFQLLSTFWNYQTRTNVTLSQLFFFLNKNFSNSVSPTKKKMLILKQYIYFKHTCASHCGTHIMR